MNDWNKLEFVTEEESTVADQRSGWSAVRFQLADEDAAGEDESIAENFFVSFDSLW